LGRAALSKRSVPRSKPSSTRTPKDAWREPASSYKPQPGSAEYLRVLAANGYALAAIEEVLIGERTPTSCTASWHTTRDARRLPVSPAGPAGGSLPRKKKADAMISALSEPFATTNHA